MADRLSGLPDGLLSVILSKLPIADSIGCSILSKRWRFLYREMPHLLLSPALLTPPRLLPPERSLLSMAALESRISNILRLHSSDLDTFFLSADDHITDPWNLYTMHMMWEFRPQILWEWLQCVARKNVQRLFLKCSNNVEIPPPALFSCNRLTTLTLYNYILTDFPSGFKHLTECTLMSVRMTDESLARFLSLCPLLHNFNLEDCDGLKRPVIAALNVTYLDVDGCNEDELIVNCPNLKTMSTITNNLKVNGMGFHDLSSSITGLEMELGGNLIGLSLYSRWSSDNLSANRFLELVGTLRSLKVLSIDLGHIFPKEEWIAVPLLNLLSRLPNLERFHLLGELILEAPERDHIPPYLMSPLRNLELVEIELNEYDDKELCLLGCLLQIAPALKEVKLEHASEHDNEESKLFLEKWEALKKSHEQGTPTETICEFSFCF